MDVIGVIPARYSSSRFRGKVLVDIMGKPMLQHVWERAKASRILDELVIACDDEMVQKVASGFGAKTVMTSREHACGTDRISEVVNPLDVKVVVNIQGDEPLIDPMMIDSAARALLGDSSLSMATIMRKIDDPAEAADPNVVKVVVGKNDLALYFSRAPIPYLAPNSDLKEATYYKHIGLYAYTKDFLFTYKNLPVSYLERTEKLEQLRVLSEGFKIKMIETKIDTISIDTPEDLERLKVLLQKGAS
ncbi:MAG: 3-deoxy-manno-octulosonate cytidylyltransferase [Candidatus Omnitrophica bacterium]|nr:3-deoxy-manno-octulosonate cytidylyltransferase [Candidatus Omnitrophota bacterium]MDD5771595.1 3-deoxy-manno-octulosonate cytidylyltransferase [Candidatus Omnitrophota bacterium]